MLQWSLTGLPLKYEHPAAASPARLSRNAARLGQARVAKLTVFMVKGQYSLEDVSTSRHVSWRQGLKVSSSTVPLTC
jgi:hypothetical protein